MRPVAFSAKIRDFRESQSQTSASELLLPEAGFSRGNPAFDFPGRWRCAPAAPQCLRPSTCVHSAGVLDLGSHPRFPRIGLRSAKGTAAHGSHRSRKGALDPSSRTPGVRIPGRRALDTHQRRRRAPVTPVRPHEAAGPQRTSRTGHPRSAVTAALGDGHPTDRRGAAPSHAGRSRAEGDGRRRP